MRLGFRVLFFLLMAGVAWSQSSSEPRLIASQPPTYPAIARTARIQGDVRVNFVLGASGKAISVSVVSGPPLLWHAAEENVRSWRFELPNGVPTERSYTTTFHFKISTFEGAYQPKVTVKVNSFRDIEVVANTPSGKYFENCPSEEESKPPRSVNRGDSVRLFRSACFGTCPEYQVTVSENGDVAWKGLAYVTAIGVRQSRIDPRSARALIRRFLDPKFWALCGNYSSTVTDNPGTDIEVHIGGRSKTVSNYANSAPSWVETFEDSIDAAADTHLWRHGDPRKEPLNNILSDAWLPKPGVTPLMTAAADANVTAMKLALETGADVNAIDSSGWTALMYAAAGGQSKSVELLLKAGANPNHKSFGGDTPMMASAIMGVFDRDLLRAGGDVNARNSHGLTVLMILAAEGNPDEVKAALNAGANPSMKDSRGRSAIDYLRLANCGKSPVMRWRLDPAAECDQLDEDDFRQVKLLLKRAIQKTAH